VKGRKFTLLDAASSNLIRNQTSWNSPTMWRWIFHKKSKTLPSDGSRTRLPRCRISAIGNSDFTEGGGGEPSETEVVTEHRGSAMQQRGRHRVAGGWFTADSRGGQGRHLDHGWTSDGAAWGQSGRWGGTGWRDRGEKGSGSGGPSTGGRRAKKRYQVALHSALLPYLDLSIECNKCASCLGQNSFSFIKGNIRSNRNKLTIK
jgi:hypothetical protein